MIRVLGGSDNPFRALKVRNYRLFLSGMVVSNIGTWTQQVAQDFVVLRLSNGSGVAMGTVVAAQYLPMLLFGAWGGLVADRFDKRKVLLGSQTALGATAMVLGILVSTGTVTLGAVYLLALVYGCAFAVDAPTRQSFSAEMVGTEQVSAAVGLTSATFNLSKIIGPAVGSLLIVTIGYGPTFFVNAVSYLAVVGALLAMRPAELQRRAPVERRPGQVRDALAYVRRTPAVRDPILLMAVVSTFGINFIVLLPLLATDSLSGGVVTYSVLSSTMSIGSLAGALVAAGRRQVTPRLRIGAGVAFGAASVAVAVAPNLVSALPCLVVLGACTMTFLTSTNTSIQVAVDPQLRGRVISFYSLVLIGSTPIGGPLMGWIANQTSPRVAIAVGGIVALGASAVAWRFAARHGEPARAVRSLELAVGAPTVSPGI